MLQGQSFEEAVKSLSGINPDSPIRALMTRAMEEGGEYKHLGCQFHHCDRQRTKKSELERRLKDWPSK